MPSLDWAISPAVFSPQGLLNPAVVALLGILNTQLLKAAIPERPWKSLVVQVISLLIVAVFELYVALIMGGTPADWVRAGMLTIWGGAAATFGYESVKNIAKALGLWKTE
jgi:hypothetical protein